MTQHHTFPDGGFVLHKIEIDGHKYSAWYGKDGIPLDAEMFVTYERTRSVAKRNKNVWLQLANIGKRYV